MSQLNTSLSVPLSNLVSTQSGLQQALTGFRWPVNKKSKFQVTYLTEQVKEQQNLDQTGKLI